MNLRFFILLPFFLVSYNISGMENLVDYLILKGDTFKIVNWPLEDYFRTTNKPDILYSSKTLKESGVKDYSAYWKLDNDSLVLSKITVGRFGTEVDLSLIFNTASRNNKVFANWFNKSIFIFLGNPILPDFYRFEYEKEYSFTNGIISDIKLYDNTKSFISKYSKDPELLRKFIQKKINYNNIPDLNENVEILISVEKINDLGKIDSVSIYKGFNDLFNNEAIRVVKSIPQWDILYAHGKRSDIHYLISVTFEKELKKKYNR